MKCASEKWREVFVLNELITAELSEYALITFEDFSGSVDLIY